MGKFVVGLIAGLVIFPLLVVAYLTAGLAPAAATAPPMPFERFIAGTALQGRISREAPKRDASAFTPDDLEDGAKVYKKNCAMCHGAFSQSGSQPAPPIAKGMFPQAPQLLTSEGMVTDDPVGETYWKVKNGIRLSGMPSFASILMEKQMWDVSALLARANAIPPGSQRELQSATEPSPIIPDSTPKN